MGFGSLVHQINSAQEVLKLKQNFLKNKAVTGKTPLFLICLALTLAPDMAVLNGNDAFSIFVFLTKKLYSSFLKNVFPFQKIYFRVKVLKMFKLFTDCDIKTYRSLKRRAVLKISIIFFTRNYALSVGFKMKPLKKAFSSDLRQKPIQISP